MFQTQVKKNIFQSLTYLSNVLHSPIMFQLTAKYKNKGANYIYIYLGLDCEDQDVDEEISAITCTTDIDLSVVSKAPVVVFDLETTGLSE